jgi:hypothetical protein
MAKRKQIDPLPDEPPFTIREYREALGDSFLSHRPSFDRCVRRLARKAPEMVEYFHRGVYEPLMDDIRRLESLLKEANVDTDQYEVERYTVNSWSPGNFQVKAHLKRRADGTLRPPEVRPYTPSIEHAVRRADVICIPDIHFGFTAQTIVGDDGVPRLDWQPIHDPRAVAVMLAVCEHAQPRDIVILGDMLDLPGLGRWDTTPTQRHQTMSAMQAARQFLSDLRTVCPATRIRLLEGNHEKRLADYMARNAPEMLWATDVPGLLGCDDFRVEYIGPYLRKTPLDSEGAVWAYHGTLIGRRGGESAAKMLAEYPTASTVFGHTHRLELAWHTEWDAFGRPQHVFSMGCGTLARIDGAVPGSSCPDWMQGFGVISSGRPSIVPIQDGTCYFQDKLFGAGDPVCS